MGGGPRISATTVALVVALGLLAAGVQSATPGLRPDDGDLEKGGAGRDSTCSVASSEEDNKAHASAAAGGAEAAARAAGVGGGGAAKVGVKKTTPPLKKQDVGAYVKEEEGDLVLQVEFEELYVNATENGDAEAQYWLGRMFETGLEDPEVEDGDVIEKDMNQAAGLFSAAAAAGHGGAALALGKLYAEHNDPDKAAETYLQAAELGNVEAVSRLGMLYEDAGHAEEALTLFTQAAEGGDPLGQALLAEKMAHGNGVEKDIAAAARLFKSAAEAGEAMAHGGLGRLYEGGLLGGINLELAAKHYKEGAEGGNHEAMRDFARCLRLGLGVDKDCEAADEVEPELTEVERGVEAVRRMEAELAGAKLAGTLAGGRPSRYTYLPTYTREQTEEERKAEEEAGWDGSYAFVDDTIARYRYSQNADYYMMPGVVAEAA